jgi:hypothetical protein
MAVTILSSILATSAVSQEDLTVAGLRDYCKGANRSKCAGYVVGVIGLRPLSKPEGVKCPDKLNLDEVVDAFLHWSDKHPERWQEPGFKGVRAAMDEKFPCH